MSNYNFMDNTGLVVVDAASIRSDVEREYRAIFGEDLDVSSSTPQGRLIDAEVLARRASLESMAQIANQINPDYSGGIFLDSLCAFLDTKRRGETPSILRNVRLTGVPRTVIVKGSLARDQNGNTWRTMGNSVISSTGSTTVDFECLAVGPVTCAVGQLNRVVSSILGWETVNNPSTPELGGTGMSDAQLRTHRRDTLAQLGVSTSYSIESRLYAKAGNVRSVIRRENITSSSKVIDGIKMPPHSLWVCVQGGDRQLIAEQLLYYKTIGAQWVGAVEVKVVDDFSGQTYPVRFDVPTEVPVFLRVQVRQGTFTGDATENTKDAIMAYAAGDIDGYDGFVVRSPGVSTTTIAGAVQKFVPGLLVYDMDVSRTNAASGFVCGSLDLGLKEVATITRTSIQVTVIK